MASETSARAQWISAFSGALLDLRPKLDDCEARRIAFDLCDELRHFDPILAAEMHHESELTDA